jgi:hypothetical protein
VAAPLFLTHPKDEHWLQPLPEHDAVYAQMNNIDPAPHETVPQFGLRLRKVLKDTGAHNVILDLRRNNGGNTFQYVELLRTLTAFSTDDTHTVFVLIGRANYSAAANFMTDLERITRPIFVGEPTSMTGNGWGDESVFVLPYSGLFGSFAGVRWQLSNPWDKRRSLQPAVPVQLTANAYFAGQDPVIDTVFKMIADQSWRS